MAEHFKLVVTPKGTQIITFTGVDEYFAQIYGDMLAYAKMLAGDNGKDDKPIFDVTDPQPLTMEYVFSYLPPEPLTEEQQTKLDEAIKLRKEKKPNKKLGNKNDLKPI